ncbi:hypothetical protein [Victivallis vadensis]|uniref:hypothetical protein n=1 Tax=Victivallis vadensis TaxID=172901 RepID=UPI00266CF392|nr:hypothetical protein [Victivallis vadensis]
MKRLLSTFCFAALAAAAGTVAFPDAVTSTTAISGSASLRQPGGSSISRRAAAATCCG